MPAGKAPYPKKKHVDAGKADKSKPVRGGYERASDSDGRQSRRITYGKKGSTVTMGYAPGPSNQVKKKKK